MNRKFLGDSHDAVKRLWKQVLSRAGFATLYAEKRFIKEDGRAEFTRLTEIEVLSDETPQGPYAILNDPDTGIHLLIEAGIPTNRLKD